MAFLRRTPNARGCNLTLPHKIDIMPLLDRVDPMAAHRRGQHRHQAPDGSLEGRNSDGFGFLAALSRARPTGRPRRDRSWCWAPAARRAPSSPAWWTPACRSCAWSTARSGAIDLGVAFTPNDGRRIAIERWDERATCSTAPRLLVNTTSLGMKGQPPLELDLARLPRNAVVDDIVYVPLETPLLAAARARGHRCVDGLGMLLHQGRMGFEAWFGQKVAVSAEQRRAVAADLGA